MKNFFKIFGIITLIAVIGFSMAGCDSLFDNGETGKDDKDDGYTSSGGKDNGGKDNGGGVSGGGSGSGNSVSNTISVTVGYSSSHTISSSGQHWFKFEGTGDPVIFETTGSVVDTYMAIWDNFNDASSGNWVDYSDDNSGEGSNALRSFTTTSEKTYWIKITPRSSTSGTYTFVVKSPTSNLRTNPITVSVGNSSSHIIFSSGTHWFTFTGTGDRVFFETEGNVVKTNLSIYIGDSTSSSYTKGSNEGINFITVSGTMYYINITGNSGTYIFNVRNGTGDGSSSYNAIEVTNGYSSSYTITSSGKNWFMYYGTGNSVTFKTTGNEVDTYLEIWDNFNDASSGNWVDYSNDDGGEGSNALRTITATSGRTYWIKITARKSTNGTYTFVVE
jgi:hypothetical protein